MGMPVRNFLSLVNWEEDPPWMQAAPFPGCHLGPNKKDYACISAFWSISDPTVCTKSLVTVSCLTGPWPCQGCQCFSHTQVAKPSSRVWIWMLMMTAENAHRSFSSGCSRPEDCSPTEMAPTTVEIRSTYLLVQSYKPQLHIYLHVITLSPCWAVFRNPAYCSIVHNKHSELPKNCGFFIRGLSLFYPQFFCVCVSTCLPFYHCLTTQGRSNLWSHAGLQDWTVGVT